MSNDDAIDDRPDEFKPRPVEKTDFLRMRDSASAEAGRIEIVQTALIMAGIGASEAELKRRDDFDGMVRLIDIILGNAGIKRELLEQLRRYGR